MTLPATTATAMAMRTTTARLRRVRGTSVRRISIGLGQVDEDGVGGEKRDDERDEIEQVAQIEHAAGDRGEMAEKAYAGDRADEPLGGPFLKEAEHGLGSGGDQHKHQSHRDDKGDDLVFGRGGD